MLVKNLAQARSAACTCYAPHSPLPLCVSLLVLFLFLLFVGYFTVLDMGFSEDRCLGTSRESLVQVKAALNEALSIPHLN